VKYKIRQGKGEKPPKGAEHKAPKKWWDEQVVKIRKQNLIILRRESAKLLVIFGIMS